MEKIKIVMPCDEISEEELLELVSNFEGTTVDFNEGANLTGELFCTIITTAIMIPQLAVSIAAWKEARLANRKVRLVSVDGNRTIVANIRLGELSTIEFDDIINK